MSRTARAAVIVAAAVVVVVLAGVAAVVLRSDDESPGGATATTAATASCAAATPERLAVEVVRTLPHDPGAYTQGLVVADGRLFESTGREGASTVREVDPGSGEVLDRAALPSDQFAEGLTMDPQGRLVQLTWLDGLAYVRDPDSLEVVEEYSYVGEGWGLTTLGDGTLVMTDGSDVLTLRDPEDFTELEARVVQRVGGGADLLNELDWDGEWLWANRYQTDELLRIDPECATVTGVADLAPLREAAAAEAASNGTPIDVTNGIAHLPGTDRYLVTGKWWPTMYEVRIS